MRFVLGGVFSFLLSGAGFAASTVFTWQPVDGNADGLFTDPVHWGLADSYPGETTGDQTACFPAAEGRTSRIYFPDGTFDNYSAFRTCIANGQSTWFIGTNTTWNLPALTDGTSRDTCVVYLNAATSATAKNGSALRDAQTDASARLTLKDFKIEHSSTAARGTCLDVWEGEVISPVSNWFYSDNNNAADRTGRFELCFHPGTKSSLQGLYIGSMSATNAFTFLGGTHALGNWRQQWNVGNPPAGTKNQVDFTFRGGADVSFAGAFNLGYASGTASSAATRYNVSASERATVTVNGGTYMSGTFDFDIAGADTLWTFGAVANFGNAKESHVAVRVADGAKIAFLAAANCGAQTAAALEGNTMDFLVTNATLEVNSANGALTLHSGMLSIVDSDVVIAWGAGIRASSAAGATPNCYLNGARFELTTTGTFLGGFKTVALGDRGLSVYSKHPSHAYDISQSFADAPGETGTLTLGTQIAGLPYTLGATSAESRLVIANGTAVLAAGANHYSHLTVRGGATFSMKDNANATTLRGLTLGDGSAAGAFELDPTDTVRVEGPVSFANGVFRYSATLPYGTNVVFTSTAATAEEKSAWLLRAGFSIDGLPEGAFVTYDLSEDEGVTSFRVVVRESVPTGTGDNVWSGEGESASWNVAANWNGAPPSATECAVFDGGIPKAVTIDGTVEAAGLRFAEGGYSLSGGTLKLTQTDAARVIDVQKSPTAIDSALLLTEFADGRAEVYVADGAELDLSGCVRGGGIDKTGPGKLVLGNTQNFMPQGVVVHGGVLSVTDPLALGGETMSDIRSQLAVDTLEIAGNRSGKVPGAAFDVTSSKSDSGAVVFKADVDATLRLGDSAGASVFKRGAGALALQVDVDRTLALESSESKSVTKASDLRFAENGSAPELPRGSINVVEGELAFRGAGETPTVTLPRTASMGTDQRRIYIGYPTQAALGAEPKLVLDNVSFKAEGHALHFASCLGALATASAPELIVTNGAALSGWMFLASSDTDRPGLTPKATFDRGTLVTQAFTGNASGTFAVTNRYEFRNGSALYVLGQNECNGPTEMVFDHSTFAGSKTGGAAQVLRIKKDFVASANLLAMDFRNGSFFGCAGISGNSDAANVRAPVGIRFDGAEWFAGAVDRTLPAQRVEVTTVVAGAGLTLAPPPECRWTWVGPMVGEGGLVKAGEGTVRFGARISFGAEASDPVTLAYAGMTDIREGVLELEPRAVSNFVGRAFRIGGTLDLTGGELAFPVLVPAGGSVRNGTLFRPTVAVSTDEAGAVENPVTFDFANGCALVGRVVFDFGRTDETALPRGTAIANVARWTGTKPDVSRWRGANVGSQLGCVFEARDDGSIQATVAPNPGLVLILR